MTSSFKLRRLCYAYIDRVLDGYWGNQARAECHMEFIKLFFPEDWMLLSNELLDILHNLDTEVGLSFDGPNGQDVPPAHRKRYARLLFQRLEPFLDTRPWERDKRAETVKAQLKLDLGGGK